MRLQASTTPPSSAMAPPERPVPAPRATKGTPAAAQARTRPATCAVSVGKATATGRAPCSVLPSCS